MPTNIAVCEPRVSLRKAATPAAPVPPPGAASTTACSTKRCCGSMSAASAADTLNASASKRSAPGRKLPKRGGGGAALGTRDAAGSRHTRASSTSHRDSGAGDERSPRSADAPRSQLACAAPKMPTGGGAPPPALPPNGSCLAEADDEELQGRSSRRHEGPRAEGLGGVWRGGAMTLKEGGRGGSGGCRHRKLQVGSRMQQRVWTVNKGV
eukprot:352687-Chlamydomonas_euryale.AAC.5